MSKKIGRNDPCPCGSGKKYKKCCLNKKDFVREQKKATQLMEEERFKEAEAVLRKVLNNEDNVTIRNNLAKCLFELGKNEECLDILRTCLEPEREELAANPFTLALASRAFVRLGEKKAGKYYLEMAEKFFEEGLDIFRKEGIDEEDLGFWKEYTLSVLKAAGELEDHSRVLELYYRWKSEHVGWESAYLAGVASFNLKDYTKAATFWGEIGENWFMFYGFKEVATLVEKGLIPPFVIGYKILSHEQIERNLDKVQWEEEYMTSLIKDGNFLMVLLAMVFDLEVEVEMAKELIDDLVHRGEEWGEDLGKRILESPHANTSFKMAAARGLVEKGVYSSGEFIPMIIDGEKEEVKIKKLPVESEADQENREAMEKARELKEKGNMEEAIRTLEEVCYKDNFCLPVAINLSNLLRMVGRLEEAENYLRMVENIDPYNIFMLFNMACLFYQKGDTKGAEEYLEKMNLEEADQELLEKVDQLRDTMKGFGFENLLEKIRRNMAAYEEEKRARIENKTLSPHEKLSRCLKNLPANWTKEICFALEMEPASRREERQGQIEEAFLEKRNLSYLMEENFSPEDKEVLVYLLEKGGWAPLEEVSEKFGSMEGDGFLWNRYLPNSSLGTLWLYGLAVVGKAKLDKRRKKIVVVPLELREPLSILLGVKTKNFEPATIWDYLLEDEGVQEEVFIFRVNLTDKAARVRGFPYRILAIPQDFTLYQLALAILDSFDFEFDHSFGFYDNLKNWTRAREGYEYFTDLGEGYRFPGVEKTLVKDVFKETGKRMLFLFDYGDEWHFLVRLMKEVGREEQEEYPGVIKGEGEVEQYD
ncbi:MAG: hypothetical protein D5R97_08195 [Candidatus Syntrophonatronum acetioxidans]|uniref:Plasmid pRiA4b Orf3-like domain-containing protein n=1 Tax=Candidatus Syntrophonatronum acetioxidans TaxID=1795816 RepID=A0A424YBA6_9FIRM|nr:MAG: hypothetical protein D5R97_08195 [Candidatus Syntrophonatronum acetioxidans]